MADYLIHDSTLEDIADAIRAKTGGSALINPEDMADEIDGIQTGGGGASLPSIISKIDGGSFTPSSDTTADLCSISHNLGVIPKGWIVWTEDEISGTVATRYIYTVGMVAINVVDKNSNAYTYTGFYGMFSNGTANGQLPAFKTSQIANHMTTTTLKYNNSLLYYKSGVTYNWLAWA